MKGVELTCPHCNKKIVIPESMIAQISKDYQKMKKEEAPSETTSIEPEKEPVKEPISLDLKDEFLAKREQLAMAMSKLERNQANLMRLGKRSVLDEELNRVQKERVTLMQEIKKIQSEMVKIKGEIEKSNKNQKTQI